MRRFLHALKAFLQFFTFIHSSSFVFFLFLSLLHICFKVALGLYITVEDGYGFTSFVAPPQSLLFATSDVVFAYIFAKLLDWFPAQKLRIWGHLIALVVMHVFLISNFMIHMCFKSFLNYSLIQFNGAGTTELSDYFVNGLNRYSVTFFLVGIAIILLFARYGRPLKEKPIFSKKWLGPTLFAASLTIWQFTANTLNAGQECWMLDNPLMLLVKSSYKGMRNRWEQKQIAKDIHLFTPPGAPIHGQYPFSSPPSVAPVPKANVLLLLFESLPANRTSLHKDTKSKLDFWKRLKPNSINFSNMRTVFPATSRSFISYHCGTYPGSDLSTISKYVPRFDCDSIVKRLKKEGYRTGFFTPSIFSYDNLITTDLMKSYDVSKHFFDFQSSTESAGLLAQAVEEEIVADETFRFMTESSEPFFATYFSFWTHAPYRVPNKDIGHLSKLERFYLTQEYLNKVTAKLIDKMNDAHLLDNTIVIFVSDHGEGFGTYHAGNFNHGGAVWEENIRIPFFVYVPGMNQSLTVDRIGSNIDFASTLFGLLGIAPSPGWEGQNLLSNQFKNRPQLFFSRSSVIANGILDGDLKYFYINSSGENHLYNLSTDPTEQHNLAAKNKQNVSQYRSLVDKWLIYQNWKINDSQHNQ